MLEPTRKRRTKKEVSSYEDSDVVDAEKYLSEIIGDKPGGAVALSGYRYREDLTQEQLGKMIGVSQYNISKMERGHRPIGKDIAKRLAKALNCDYRVFL